MLCIKVSLKYGHVHYENPGASLAALATSSFHLLDDDSFSFCFLLHHWLDWRRLAEGDPFVWNTCFPPASFMRSHLWTLYKKLAGILHGWVGSQKFFQESVPNWHHMGGHLCDTLPALHQTHLPTYERDQGRSEGVQEYWQRDRPNEKAKPGRDTVRFMSWVVIQVASLHFFMQPSNISSCIIPVASPWRKWTNVSKAIWFLSNNEKHILAPQL